MAVLLFAYHTDIKQGLEVYALCLDELEKLFGVWRIAYAVVAAVVERPTVGSVGTGAPGPRCLRHKRLLEEPLHRFEGYKRVLALHGLPALLVGERPGRFLDRDVIQSGNMAYSVRVRHTAVFHEEMHRAASLSAAEALAYVPARVDVEGRCALRVERAKADPAGAAAFQFHEVFHDVVDLNRLQYRVYGLLRYHSYAWRFQKRSISLPR